MANKFVFLPPQSDLFAKWIPRLLDSATGWDIATPNTEEDALRELPDADAAYGTMTHEMIANYVGSRPPPRRQTPAITPTS
jgi:hypothetical protein